MINYSDFLKLDLRIGKIMSSTRVEGTDKLIKLEVDLGNEKKQIVAGMAEFIKPEHLIGKLVPVLANLEPRKLKGVESHGMILAGDVNGRPVLLHPETEIPPGTIIK